MSLESIKFRFKVVGVDTPNVIWISNLSCCLVDDMQSRWRRIK